MTDTNHLNRIEGKIDDLTREMADLRVTVEHRVTKLEVKSGMWGAVGGIVTTLAWHFRGGS